MRRQDYTCQLSTVYTYRLINAKNLKEFRKKYNIVVRKKRTYSKMGSLYSSMFPPKATLTEENLPDQSGKVCLRLAARRRRFSSCVRSSSSLGPRLELENSLPRSSTSTTPKYLSPCARRRKLERPSTRSKPNTPTRKANLSSSTSTSPILRPSRNPQRTLRARNNAWMSCG